jgi:acetolactate synthase small subunit
MRYTIIAITENTPGVLYRIASLFLQGQINIEKLTVSAIDEVRGRSQFCIEFDDEEAHVQLLLRRLQRLVDVEHVEYHTAPKV